MTHNELVDQLMFQLQEVERLTKEIEVYAEDVWLLSKSVLKSHYLTHSGTRKKDKLARKCSICGIAMKYSTSMKGE